MEHSGTPKRAWPGAVVGLVAVIVVLAVVFFRPSPPPLGQPPASIRGSGNPQDAPDDEPQVLDARELGTYTKDGKRGPKANLKGVVLNPQKPGSSGWPKVEVPASAIALLQALRDLDRERSGRDREALAASAAALLRDDPARLQDLISSLSGPTEADLRRVALILLGRVDRPEAVQALLEAARRSGDREERILAIRSVLQNGKPSAHEAYAALDFRPLVEDVVAPDRILPLVDLMRQERDRGVFQGLVESLSKFQDGESGVTQVTRAAADLLREENDPARMRDLFLGFSYTRSPIAREAIVEKLGTLTDRDSLALGIQALGYQEETPAVLDLKLRYATDSTDAVRKKALEALANVQRGPEDGARVARQIGPAVVSDGSSLVRLAGITALGGCGEAGRTYLEKMAAADSDPQVRQAARQLLDRVR